MAGVMILIKGKEVEVQQVIMEERLQWMVVKCENKVMETFNIYLPPERKGRMVLFKKLEVYICGGRKHILLWYLNCIIKEGDKRKVVGKGELNSSSEVLINMIKEEV